MDNLHRAIIVGVPVVALLNAYSLIELSEPLALAMLVVWMLTFVLGLRESAARVNRRKTESLACVGEADE